LDIIFLRVYLSKGRATLKNGWKIHRQKVDTKYECSLSSQIQMFRFSAVVSITPTVAKNEKNECRIFSIENAIFTCFVEGNLLKITTL